MVTFMLILLGAVVLFMVFVSLTAPSDEQLATRPGPAATIRHEGRPRPKTPERRELVKRDVPAKGEVDADGDAEVSAEIGANVDHA